MIRKTLKLTCAVFSVSLCLASCTGRGNRNVQGGTEFTESRHEETSYDIGFETEIPSPTNTAEISDTLPHGVEAIAKASLTEDEIDLIARLVAAEAGNRPYMTKVCLAALILNRIESNLFPSTAVGVIFENGEFESVSAGLVTENGEGEDTSSVRYYSAKKAVLKAADGYDPTNGAVYFSSSDEVLPSANTTYKCGGVIFSK